ncbi:MAG: hypothetical protein KAR08_09750 [Candidatus Heimdallarchaeota archaeon]|nr:hypothetical protein [Candidatus Heimdallarchaeota archaeon]
MKFIRLQPEQITCPEFQAHLIETGRDALITVDRIRVGQAEASTNTRVHIADHDALLMEVDEDGKEYPSEYNGYYCLTEHLEDELCG